VVGGGIVGVVCEADGKLYLNSKDTGFTEMMPETIAALGTAVGKGIAVAMGTGAAVEAGAGLLGMGADALMDGGGEDFPDIPMPTEEDTE